MARKESELPPDEVDLPDCGSETELASAPALGFCRPVLPSGFVFDPSFHHHLTQHAGTTQQLCGSLRSPMHSPLHSPLHALQPSAQTLAHLQNNVRLHVQTHSNPESEADSRALAQGQLHSPTLGQAGAQTTLPLNHSAMQTSSHCLPHFMHSGPPLPLPQPGLASSCMPAELRALASRFRGPLPPTLMMMMMPPPAAAVVAAAAAAGRQPPSATGLSTPLTFLTGLHGSPPTHLPVTSLPPVRLSHTDMTTNSSGTL
ncbi:unnamed protein product [Protopolystoma xenopodis]|uniref:Uncharacterized protein n=1 Tax=Protopolystoma xenopodis TaxID=117903 RepID=A0A3S5ALS0_9PLAT|nr:unnamed protein product [Protopolystoma xenopodis]